MVLIVQQEQILEPGEVNLSVSTTIFEMQIIIVPTSQVIRTK